MPIKVGDVVALCCCGTRSTRRLRNVTVTKVMKTFIEIDDSSRYSVANLRQIRGCNGGRAFGFYYLDEQVSYWDSKEDRDNVMQNLNRLFESLTNASKSRNWDQVKTCFANLSNFIGE